jgi:hypothetical protein
VHVDGWNFVICGREQAFLLAPGVRERLAEDDLARCVIALA